MDFNFMVHLEDLSLAELQKLIDDEDQINQFILDDERLKRMKLDRELILAENRSIADDSLGKEPKLMQLKVDLEEKYTAAKQLHDTYRMNLAKLASLGKEDNLDEMLAVLQTKSMECEERTEYLSERFNNKEMGITDFLTSFKEIRTTAHLRLVKTDKMKELVLEVRRNHVSNPAPYNPPNPYSSPPHPTPRGRNTSIHSSHPPTNMPYPPYPGYGSSPQQPPNPYPRPQQAYPEYSW